MRIRSSSRGRTRLEITSAVSLPTLAEAAHSAGDVTRFSYEPPALSDLFREAVAR